MAQDVKDFDFETADLQAYLENVKGLHIVYRNKMLGILKSENNEMPRMAEFINDLDRAAEGFDKDGNAVTPVKLMTPAFRAGFVTVFNMNAHQDHQIQ